jgi:uncharacterized protein
LDLMGKVSMDIWVDADACPVVIKEILYKVADRTDTKLTLVANQTLRIPKSPNIGFILVEAGFDVADERILELAKSGDLVITNDVPLAAELIQNGCLVINPRGERLSEDNIGTRLYMRDFMDNLRGGGIETGGPPPMSKQDKQNFANCLDRLMA